MKITSLNVNQFFGLGSRKDYPSKDPEKKEKKWIELKERIIKIINESLEKDDDILLLQEIPYKMYPEASNSVKVSKVYLDLQKTCEDERINIYKTNSNCDVFKTIALSKEKYEYAVDEEIVKEAFRLKKYEDCRLVVLKKDLALNNEELYIVGIHNFSEHYLSIVFLHNLEKFINCHFKNKNVIVCGDINIYADAILNKIEQKFLHEMNLCDAWINKGYNNDDEKGFTYKKSRIDKFFINKDKIRSYEIKVGKEIDEKVSDHNSISLIINSMKG